MGQQGNWKQTEFSQKLIDLLETLPKVDSHLSLQKLTECLIGTLLVLARLRSFISSVILPSSLSYVPCTVLKFRALDRFPGRNVLGIFYPRNFLNWVLTALFHPLANV